MYTVKIDFKNVDHVLDMNGWLFKLMHTHGVQWDTDPGRLIATFTDKDMALLFWIIWG